MAYILLIMVLGQVTMPEEMTFEYDTQSMIEEVDPNLYIIGPGDILWFSIHGGMPSAYSLGTSSFRTFPVTPDGYAVLPGIGVWYISGMTLAQAADMIETGFARRYPGLSGTAGLARMREFQVPVTGHVNDPGIVEITGVDGVTVALSKAGGISPTGSWSSVQLIDSEGDTTTVNINNFLMYGDLDCMQNLTLGYRVHVPEAREFVNIEGAFNTTNFTGVRVSESNSGSVWSRSVRGMIEYIPEETVSMLVARLGGTAVWADRDSCYIQRTIRDSAIVRIPCPLSDPLVDPVLEPGDLLVCPGTPPTVSVAGEVFAPGVYPHNAGQNAFFYISQAGGYLRSSSESGTRIILPDGRELETDEISSIPPGSAIRVPRKALVGWQDPLLLVTSLASIVIAWKSIF